jgi:hypothetical protein
MLSYLGVRININLDAKNYPICKKEKTIYPINQPARSIITILD